MGFQGQLSSVNLTDIFQTLHMNRQTGTLSVVSPAGSLHLYFAYAANKLYATTARGDMAARQADAGPGAAPAVVRPGGHSDIENVRLLEGETDKSGTNPPEGASEES